MRAKTSLATTCVGVALIVITVLGVYLFACSLGVPGEAKCSVIILASGTTSILLGALVAVCIHYLRRLSR
jgi:biotin transporter BioY